MRRDRLRYHCIKRQHGLCIICGHGVEDDAAVHEAIVKRSDLPKDPRIFEPWNCVAVHNSNPKCRLPHERYGNTETYDSICRLYLVQEYGVDYLAECIKALEMKQAPTRAIAILSEAGSEWWPVNEAGNETNTVRNPKERREPSVDSETWAGGKLSDEDKKVLQARVEDILGDLQGLLEDKRQTVESIDTTFIMIEASMEASKHGLK